MDNLPMTPYVLALLPGVLHNVIIDRKLPIKTIVGGVLYGAFLVVIAAWRYDVASALAWVVAMSSILINGRELFGFVTDAIK